MPTQEEALAALTKDQRQTLWENPELSATFRAEVQTKIDAIKPVGVSWGGAVHVIDFVPSRMFDKVQREAGYAKVQAEISAQDHLINVVLTGDAGLRVETDLDTLCRNWKVDWSERRSIREAVASGWSYRGDYAGWTKFKLQHTIVAAQFALEAA